MVLPLSITDCERWPPAATLANISPRVKTNQAPRTTQRWRALHTATLTVQGSRPRTGAPWRISLSTGELLLRRRRRCALCRDCDGRVGRHRRVNAMSVVADPAVAHPDDPVAGLDRKS